MAAVAAFSWEQGRLWERDTGADLLIERESENPGLHIICAVKKAFSLCRRQFNGNQWGGFVLVSGFIFSPPNYNGNEEWQEIKTYI